MTLRRLKVVAVKYWILCKVLWWWLRHPRASTKDIQRQWMLYLLHYVSRQMKPLHGLSLSERDIATMDQARKMAGVRY